MLTEISVPTLLEPLLRFGDDETLRERPEGWRDYITELGLTHGDVPALLTVLAEWVRIVATESDVDESPDPTWCAPIHAWRALGQLGAVEAVGPMLAMADRLDEGGDDWSLEDWRHVYGLIGPAALAALATFAADGSHREFARVMAADGMTEIGEQHSAARQAVVSALSEQLSRHEEGAPIVNASLAGGLLKLKAVESAEVIERAFAADVIDESMYGCWGDFRRDLGVEGLGLAPLEPRRRWMDFPDLRSRNTYWGDVDRPVRDRQKAKREKAKRKAAAKARKRNRRAK